MPSIVHRTTTTEFDAGLNCVLSDLTPDAYSDIVGDRTHPTLGWDTTNFKRNPIALWSRDSRSPIGTWRDVGVNDGALRGRLHLAPPGSTKLVDELRALLAANVVKGISVGFKPVESEPRSNGGTHYLRQVLVEASLVAIPANPSALLTAKALGISEATQRLVFKQTDGERIRSTRRVIAKLKARLAREHLIVTHEVTNTGSDRSQLANVAREAKAVLAMSAMIPTPDVSRSYRPRPAQGTLVRWRGDRGIVGHADQTPLSTAPAAANAALKCAVDYSARLIGCVSSR